MRDDGEKTRVKEVEMKRKRWSQNLIWIEDWQGLVKDWPQQLRERLVIFWANGGVTCQDKEDWKRWVLIWAGVRGQQEFHFRHIKFVMSKWTSKWTRQVDIWIHRSGAGI